MIKKIISLYFLRAHFVSKSFIIHALFTYLFAKSEYIWLFDQLANTINLNSISYIVVIVIIYS